MFARNSMSKPAQFSFAADLFMLQAILRFDETGEKPWQLEYVFPRNCYLQVIDWILDNTNQLGIEPISGVTTKSDSTEVRITFPDEKEQDKMHRFFEMFNQKRKQAQGIDPSFPPMPDIYQGGNKPVIHVIKRYLALIAKAFDGDADVVQIPSGPMGSEFTFHCS